MMEDKTLILHDAFSVEPKKYPSKHLKQNYEVLIFALPSEGFSSTDEAASYEMIVRTPTGESRENLTGTQEIIFSYAVCRLMKLVNQVNHDENEVMVWEQNKYFLFHNGYCEFCSRWFTEYYGFVALKKKCPSCRRMSRCLDYQKIPTQAKQDHKFMEQRGFRLYHGVSQKNA
jgi:phage FluMu protein Com